MIKLFGILLIFLFYGCSNQKKKDSQADINVHILSGFSENSDNYITVILQSPLYYLKNLLPQNFYRLWAKIRVFLLYHSTGHLPHNSEIDVPIVYADYYFLESIIKNKTMEKNN